MSLLIFVIYLFILFWGLKFLKYLLFLMCVTGHGREDSKTAGERTKQIYPREGGEFRTVASHTKHEQGGYLKEPMT